jgi:hypothetical protein
VNAKPEDEAVLRQEINRYFFDPSNPDIPAGNEFHRALSDALDPGIGPDDRKQILAELDPITRTDPPTPWQIAAAALAVGGLFLGPAGEGGAVAADGLIEGTEAVGDLTETTSVAQAAGADAAVAGSGSGIAGETAATVEGEASETMAGFGDTAAAASRSDAWQLGWAERGRVIEKALGGTLIGNFPVIDDFANGVATSIKSIDLDGAIYQNGARLLWRVNNYTDRVASFDGTQWGDVIINPGETREWVLKVAIPKGSGTGFQRAAINAAIEHAKDAGVKLIIAPF